MELFIKMLSKEEFLISLMKYIGEWYRYGGKNLGTGLDCSGLIYNILTKELKIQPYNALTSQGYLNYFLEDNATSVLPGQARLGDMCFYGANKDSIHHIGMAVNKTQMIEAAHGDRTVVNEFQAKMKQARVLVGPIARLPDLYTIIRPSEISFI